MIKPMETLSGLPSSAKLTVMAISVLVERIADLPKADRADLIELVLALRDATEPDERRDIQEAMEEILIGQVRVDARRMDLPDEVKEDGALGRLCKVIGRKVRQLRKQRDLTQEELAAMASIKQSHISRIESGHLSPTHMTLQKIAGALGVEVGEIDPCCE